jgi:hypothetical protein
MGEQIARISDWIDRSPAYAGLTPDAHALRRIAKGGEEHGEVIEAYFGAVGENARKGVTNGMDAVLRELLDVATAALGAYEHLTLNAGTSIDALAEHVTAVAERAGLTDGD